MERGDTVGRLGEFVNEEVEAGGVPKWNDDTRQIMSGYVFGGRRFLRTEASCSARRPVLRQGCELVVDVLGIALFADSDGADDYGVMSGTNAVDDAMTGEADVSSSRLGSRAGAIRRLRDRRRAFSPRLCVVDCERCRRGP